MSMSPLAACGRRAGITMIVLSVALGLTGTLVEGQTLSPYSEFQAMSTADLATLQVKLTYVGEFQNASLSSVLFGTSLTLLNAELFVPFYRTDQSYSDNLGQLKFTATAQELEALIDNVGTVPGVTDGDVDLNGYVSFSLLNTAGGTTKVFEAIVDSANGVALFNQVLAALSANTAGTRTLRSFACSVAMLSPTPPSNVQSQVQVKASGLRADRRSPGRFVGKVRVTNTSATAIPAPIVLAVVHHTDADLLEADGKTCSIAPSEQPFVVLLTSGSLAPSASIERTVTFVHPSKTKLEVAYKVFAGPGTP